MNEEPNVSRILERMAEGDETAFDQLFPLVYQRLRQMAANYLQGERPGHTLRATALVHEAFIKIVDQDRTEWNGRAHFMAVAAQAMRRILVDHARGRGAAKRGGGVENLTFDEELTISAEPPSIDLLALDQSLERLQALQPDKAAVVEMRFFGGLTDDEIASVLDVSSRTVVRYWKYAQAWLYRDLRDSG